MAGSVQVRKVIIVKNLSVISITVLIGYACVVSATDRLSTQPDPAWAWLERELQKDGFETDTESLVSLAKTHQEETAGLRAISILGQRGEQSAKGVLREILLKGADELVRESAAIALARLGDEEGLQALIQYFHEAKGDSKASLALVLAKLGKDVGYSQTLELSYSASLRVRVAAVRALFALFDVVKDTPERCREVGDRICVMSQDAELRVRRVFLIGASSAIPANLREMCLEEAVLRMSVEEADDELRGVAERLLLTWELRREREAP